MPLGFASWIVVAAAGYLAVGLAFGIPFVTRWAGRVDPAARSGTAGFRVLILPGSVLLWPLLLSRLARRVAIPPEERNAHRLAARRKSPP